VKVERDGPQNLTFLERLDVLAVVKPASNRRAMWVFGALGVWALVGAVTSVSAGNWDVAAISTFAAMVSCVSFGALARARRRAPTTKAWMDERGAAGPSEPIGGRD